MVLGFPAFGKWRVGTRAADLRQNKTSKTPRACPFRPGHDCRRSLGPCTQRHGRSSPPRCARSSRSWRACAACEHPAHLTCYVLYPPSQRSTAVRFIDCRLMHQCTIVTPASSSSSQARQAGIVDRARGSSCGSIHRGRFTCVLACLMMR